MSDITQSPTLNNSSNPLSPLEVEKLIRRIFEENRQVVDDKDPIFAFASICRSTAEAFDLLLHTHNAAIDAAMMQRVETFDRTFTKELRRLREETLSQELKNVLSQMLSTMEQSKNNLEEMKSLFKKFEDVSDRNIKAEQKHRKFQLISTCITAFSFMGAAAVLALIIK